MSKNKSSKKGALKDDSVNSSSTRWFCAFIFFSAFFLYANTFKHDYALDDDIYTKKNSFIQQGFSSFPDIFTKGSLVGFNGSNDSNYRPLVLLNFMAETAIWGNNPHVNHFFNVFFYSLSCILIFFFLKNAFKTGTPHVLPFLITLLFVFHPVHTEVVANIKSRDEILSLMFGTLAFILILKYADYKKTKYFFFSILFFFLGTLCKENSLTFAALIPLILFFFRKKTIKEITILSFPFIGVAGLYMVIRINVLDDVTFTEEMAVMNNSLMAAPNMADMYATNFVMMGKYLWLLFFPYNLSWDYSFNEIPVVGWSDFKALTSVLIYTALGAFAIIKLPRKNVYSFLILFYFITLFLSSNLLVKIGATMGERFLYAPSLAFCAFVPLALFDYFKINRQLFSFSSSTNLFVVIGIIICLYALKTTSRNRVWKNNYTLFESGLTTSPNSARVHYSFASESRRKGEESQDMVQRMDFYKKAVQEYIKGIEIYPESEGYYNLGVTYYNMNDTVKARKAYEAALAYKGDYAPALNNLGVIYFTNKNYDKAENYFTKVLAVDSSYADAYANVGAIHHNRGNYNEALKYYHKAIILNPNNVNTYNNMVKIYRTLGDDGKASFYEQKLNSIR